MPHERELERILRLYPDDCRPLEICPFVAAESFSGAQLWRVRTADGVLCLRRWPQGHPHAERLEFIHAVLWHVHQEGFGLVPVPRETHHRHGYVWHAGHLWELTPWLPGEASYQQSPSLNKLENALRALAEFHLAAQSFPLPDSGPAISPGILQRLLRVEQMAAGKLDQLLARVDDQAWPELALRARRLIALARGQLRTTRALLESASALRVPLAPCIRDIWHAHVLFVDETVSGLVDFGSMRPDNVATDVARLLGSMAGDDVRRWSRGLASYQAVRPLNPSEIELLSAFDRSTVLLGGLQWLEWIYLENRVFANGPAVLARLDGFVARLEAITTIH